MTLRWIRFEALETRRMLATLDSLANLGSLSVDPNSYDHRSILVRFHEDWQCAAGSCRDVDAASVFGGTRHVKDFPLVPGLQKVGLTGVGVEEALAAYRAHPAVMYAEPDYLVHATLQPDDPSFAQMWGLNNTGQTGGTPGVDIDAPDVWEVTTGSGNSIVAVIDTGVDYTHEDLAANMWVNSAEANGLPNIDDDGNGFVDDVHGFDFANDDPDPFDDQGHGTHVAGTIGAVGNNGVGVTGVNWDVQIMAVKFLDASGTGTTSDAVDAINYAVANGATISNNSWGGNEPFSQILYDAIEAAGNADHVFVAGAGNGFFGFPLNNDANPFYPASYDLDNIISVAATDHHNNLASFSNYGATTVDLAAPGVDILSTRPGNTYELLSGTSMATPHVSGVVALLRDQFPSWTYQQVIDQVLSSTVPNPVLAGVTVTGGQLNAANAIPIETPEIRVLAGVTDVADGGSFDFGTTFLGTDKSQTFTIKNIGLQDLTLDDNLSVPSGFTLVTTIADTTLSFGESTTFEVQLDANELGAPSGEISFATGDPDENPFNFSVTGTVSPVAVIDDGDAGYSTAGAWSASTGSGFQNDHQWSALGNGSDVASWTFSLVPGEYEVSATWLASGNRATNSPYTIRSGSTPLETVSVNQKLVPDDLNDQGIGWEILGTYTIPDNTLTVELTDAADQYVIADGIRIERLGDVPTGPEIEVKVDGSNIIDGLGSVDFGDTTLGNPLTKSITVKNKGIAPLALSEPISLPSGFSLASSFGTTTVPPNGTTTFTVQYDATDVGISTGEISFGTNDADEDPFDFSIVAAVSSVTFIDNGDSGYSTSGGWSTSTSGGFQGDHQWSAAGGGGDIASWTFDVTPGEYEVTATWPAAANRATNAPYTIKDGGAILETVSINQELTPDDLNDQGIGWELLGNYVVTGNALTVELSDAANEYVIADGIRIERVGGIPAGPEIQVQVEGSNLVDGASAFDYGSTALGSPVTKTFTVKNAGTESLELTEPIVVPVGFTLVSSFGTTAVAPNGSTTFAVRYDAALTGTESGEISFGNNDADESPFNFDVTGTATTPQTVSVIDNGDSGYSTSGAWSISNSGGFQGDHHWTAKGSGFDTSSWTFDVTPGEYQVAANWPAAPNRATNAPYSVLDGATTLGTVTVNQELTPDDLTDQGVGWELIGTYLVTSNMLTVELSDAANEYVIADGVRIERLGGVPVGPEVQVQVDGANIVDDVTTFEFGATELGAPVTKTFVVRNSGTSTLTLAEPISVPVGFSLVSSFGATALTPNGTTTFAVQYDAALLGVTTGEISFVSDDADESPFNIAVTGTATAPQTVFVLDNGEPGYSTSGAWSNSNGGGLQGDHHWSALGGGFDIASWTFDVTPGDYLVAATWLPAPNRATNAPYTLKDGTTALDTVPFNQELAPNDLTDQGVGWEILGTYTITGGTLTVELSDAANQYVIADGIRIERVGTSGAASVASTTIPAPSQNGALIFEGVSAIARSDSVGGSRPTENTSVETLQRKTVARPETATLRVGLVHVTDEMRDRAIPSATQDQDWDTVISELAHDLAGLASSLDKASDD